jgi:hypothetical protein
MSNVEFSLPLTDTFGGFIDVPKSQIIRSQAAGSMPHVARSSVGVAPTPEQLELLGYSEHSSHLKFTRTGENTSRMYVNATRPVLLYVEVEPEQVVIVVSAERSEVARDEIEHFRQLLKGDDVVRDPNAVNIDFHWYSGSARRKRRNVEASEWSDVRENYTPHTMSALDLLHGYEPGQSGGSGGRLIMFHGDPGTGKTTAVRTLARAWSPWCNTSYIVDPESLFSIPDYLIEIAMETQRNSHTMRSFADIDDDGDTDEGAGQPDHWLLIVVEDIDELIRADAKDRTGQALSRLLNITDGLLGQGLRTMFLLTTNEAVSSVHPAVSRPGRCIANIEFSKFSKAEANAWLGSRGVATKPAGDAMTLAQMFALSSHGVISAESAVDVQPTNGQYL